MMPDMGPSSPGPAKQLQDQRATTILATLSLGSLPAWGLAITGVVGRTLGPVRWAALLLPPAITACMLLAGTFAALRGHLPAHGRHGSRTVITFFGGLYLCMVLTLALPSLLSPGLAASNRPFSSTRQNMEHVLEQRALQHPQTGQRRRAARQLYLQNGAGVTYTGPHGQQRLFQPHGLDLFLGLLNRWILRHLAQAPWERHWLALADMALICLFLAALPAVAQWARRSAV